MRRDKARAHAIGVMISGEFVSTSEIQKYLLAVFAACFIGIGSGFLTLSEYMFERGKEAAKYAIEFEGKSGVAINKNTECEKSEDFITQCKYALYLKNSIAEIMDVLQYLANVLACIGLGCLGVVGTIEVWRKKS